ncbi:O-methyltransferase [Marixanthomonas spongiae]|uniref:SAM-dependent methyltransferase n=1 Tax=Marixanthomonas spongiae TaxID=2174845 RepID=A0A2U0I5S7_9FLAO|nr:SAM-dependent methyltransferase [Marixanthomonas spongiae]PVW16449.1 SAM-dependent methyltransferase [Marixanthomonas spongiae]
MNFIKKVIKEIFDSVGFKIEKKSSKNNLNLTKASKVLEYEYGHLESKKTKTSIGVNKEPVPWFTYPAIEYLSQLDLSDLIMLEWGAGNSSIFFSKKVKKLFSIEHNKEWYDLVKTNKPINNELIYADEDYVKKAEEFQKRFDVILIDGIKREDCAKAALRLLSKNGFIILDNCDRHPEIADMFRETGFIEVDFHGFGPINEYTWTTSLFLRRSVELKPLSFQPKIPIGGGY